MEGEVCHGEDYRAQLPGRWGAGPTPIPVPTPSPSVWAPAPLGEARPPPPSGQEDKQGWNRTGQDGMSSGQSRTGGPRLPPASREGMGVTTGSFHPSTQPAQLCASHWMQGVFSLCSLTGQPLPLQIALPIVPVGGAAGLLLDPPPPRLMPSPGVASGFGRDSLSS